MSNVAKLLPEENTKYRLITRSDMDGLVCAVLLKQLGIIDDILFVHPKDMQDGTIEVTGRDITTNVPYNESVFLCFDHHSSEAKRIGQNNDNLVLDVDAKSAARVVYDYFGGAERFPNITEDMMFAVDKADSAAFTEDDILNPQGWELLSFIMDSRTGLGRFQDFSISNYDLMMKMIDICHDTQDINDILALPDVKERTDLFYEQHEKFKEQLMRCSKVSNNVVTLDLREEENIWAGNRFMIYAIFPEASVSIHVLWGKGKQNTVFAVGKSILNKTSKTNIGELMLEHGGGGHHAAGTCQVDHDVAEDVLRELTQKIIQTS